ncbi:hypothetical protein BT93_F1117 [Corymbia citriodora subsp. variegata]|nr:hypothetical protein BT93_F1117 [Corymbia citriodora subsp. variegata]
MAKLATLAAILGVLLVASHAVEASRATITTVNIDEPENQRRPSRGCYEQIERQDLNHCEQLFEDVMRGSREYGSSRGQYGGSREYEGQYGGSRQYGSQRECSNPYRQCQGDEQYGSGQFGGEEYGQGSRHWGGQFGGQGQCSSQQLRQSRHFRPCCQQLRQLDDQCRCEGLSEVIRQQLRGSRGQGSSQSEVSRCARNLPSICGIGPRSCDIRTMRY